MAETSWESVERAMRRDTSDNPVTALKRWNSQPALLEACEAIVSHTARSADGNNFSTWVRAVAQAEAAIAAAKP